MRNLLFCLLFPTFVSAVERSVPKDHASIQAAIEASQKGDVILVEPGVYPGPLVIPEGVTVRNAGGDEPGEGALKRAMETTIDSQGKSPAVILNKGAVLIGFTVTGAGTFDSEEFEKHRETRGENLPDERGAVGTGQERPAIEIAGVTAVVEHCIVRDNGHAGIGVSGSGNHSKILRNRVYRNMGGGIGIANGAAPQVVGNHCYENLRGGIGCRAAYPVIEDNDCYRNVRAGIGVREGATPLVRKNRCYENRRAGIGVRMENTSPFLVGNHCYQNGMAGIGCRDGASPVIQGNRLEGNRLAGIGAMSNAHPVIIDNDLSGNEAAAIGFDACESGTALIYGNRIEAKSLVCLGVQGGWTITVEKNEIRRKGGMPPLVMVFSGARADFYENKFEGSGIAAVRNAGRVFLSGNQFSGLERKVPGPTRRALWNLEGASASMTDDNDFTQWKAPELPSLRVHSDEELRNALQQVSPGGTILIAPGQYRGGLSVDSLQGKKGMPITITGSDPSKPPVFEGGTSGIHFVRPEHVEFRHATISGARHNGLNCDDGGEYEKPSPNLTLKHLKVINCGTDGNHDGIKLSGIRNFRVERCHIEKWGEKGSGIDHVGCSQGVISDSVLIHGDFPAGSGIQAKGGSHDIKILRTRFVNAAGRSVNLGGSTGIAYFRPPNAPFEAKNLVVADCHFTGSMAPIAFVGIDGGLVRHCSLENPTRWVVRVLQESTDERFVRCRNGIFERNRITYDPNQISTLINVGAETEPDSFLLRGNSWIQRGGNAGGHGGNRSLPIPEVDGGFVLSSAASKASGIRWLHPRVRE